MNERIIFDYLDRKDISAHCGNTVIWKPSSMAGPTYIISLRQFSEKALKIYGFGWTWSTVVKTKLRPPPDEVGFHNWLWGLVRESGGPGVYKIVRTQAKGEGRGFHPVFYGYVDEAYARVDRRYLDMKGLGGLPSSRDLWYKKSGQPTRFRVHGKRRF